jgi:hypothetical protein
VAPSAKPKGSKFSMGEIEPGRPYAKALSSADQPFSELTLVDDEAYRDSGSEGGEYTQAG